MIREALANHYEALRLTRGVEVEYFAAERTAGVPMTLVPGQSDAEEIGAGDYSDFARTRDWLALTAEFREKVGRFPDQYDRVRVVATGSVYQLAKAGEASAWRWSDEHEVVIRMHSVLSEETK